MIPTDREELDVLAGEYVLGLLDSAQSREVADALANNQALRDAVAFWEQKLHPLSALAAPAEPPPGIWEAIAARTQPGKPQIASSPATPWKWATAAFAAVAAALILYVAVPSSTPTLVAGLHASTHEGADWIATVDPQGLHLSAVSGENPPAARVYELWAIAGQGSKPRALGVIPKDGKFQLAALPRDVKPGATLAISVEPPGGSPTGSPTGPVVFVGVLRAS
jgi:anti-sigma-K factor RskA